MAGFVIITTAKKAKELRRTILLPGAQWNTSEDLQSENKEAEEQQHLKRMQSLRENVINIVLNSTVMPFRWLATSYRCFYCYEIYETVPELKAHYLLHEREEITKVMQNYWENDVYVDISEISCTECYDKFQNLDHLVDHLVTEHEVTYDKDTKYCFKTFILKDSEVICPICDLSFDLFNQLFLHASQEHQTPVDYICDVCGRSFKKHQYKMHIHNEHRSKEVNCTQCGEKFRSTALRTHMVKVHGRNMKCKMCDETFSTHYKKQQHMTTVHRSREEIKCPHCPKIFYFPSTMNRHVKDYHLKEKNVICYVCGWKTFDQSRLTNHMVKHKDTRDVPCQFCNMMFKSTRYLKQHLQLTHADEL